MTEQDIIFICPKCGVTWRFEFKGAVFNNQKKITNDLVKIVENQPVDIHEYDDRYEITPQKYLEEAWKQIHQQLKPFGAQWVKDDTNKTNSHWTIPKPTDR